MVYIRRLIPCAPYEIKIFEAWLEELAEKEGLFLVSCRRAIARPRPLLGPQSGTAAALRRIWLEIHRQSFGTSGGLWHR